MTGWQQLADRVWVRNYESLDLNIGLVAGGDGLLVVDTRLDHVQARELRGHIREISDQPVRWVVNSHYHWDHTFGNAEFLPAAIWGHVRCAAELAERGEEQRARVREMAPEYAARFDEVQITPPDRTFTDSAAIDVGGAAVELHYLGRGHTDSDIVAVIDGVTFAGDLIENGAPPAFGDAFPLDWPDTAAALLALTAPPGPVVPGHGPVADRAFVAGQHQELAELERLARERFADGMSAEEAARAGAPFPYDAVLPAFQRAYEQLGASR